MFFSGGFLFGEKPIFARLLRRIENDMKTNENEHNPIKLITNLNH